MGRTRRGEGIVGKLRGGGGRVFKTRGGGRTGHIGTGRQHVMGVGNDGRNCPGAGVG